MLKINFKYDLEKDVDNFLRGTQSVNNPTPTKLQQLYIEKYGTDYNRETVKAFIEAYTKENNIDLANLTASIEGKWRPIEEAFIAKTEKLFGITYPAEVITAYLSTNGRSTYNIEGGYFFICAGASSTNRIVMHELLHFYTQQAFRAELEQSGVNASVYNNVKESLTELLNIEYTDLMEGAIDGGYPQHAETRQKVRELWLATKDLRRVVFGIASECNT